MRDLRRAAYEREGGRCFVTGLPLGDVDGGTWEMHHRLAGQMGGTTLDRDTLPNVIALLARVHNLGGGGRLSVHGSPAWSRPRGWLLSATRSQVPARVPALHHELGWVFLLETGGYERLAV